MSLRLLVIRSKHYSIRIMEQTVKNNDYEGCIQVLNKLQSNAEYVKSKGQPNGNHSPEQLTQVRKFLERSGLSFEKLDELSVIHVAGTKGKGTTCAFTEQILREHGYTTGFYSSPHLLEVRERIRINGKSISRAEFTHYFWRIFSALDRQKSDNHDMPLYFRFLTIMAFNIFVEKKVDVAIIEVGIGGEYDCTNILRKVAVVGITSLGIDHVSLLGSNLDSIAWNKAGIMKENCRAFTVPQPEIAMEVLKKRSIEKTCQLEVVDNLNFKLSKPYSSDVLNLNAGLAVALSKAWLTIRHNNNTSSPLMSTEITQNALSNCLWPGRFDVRHMNNISYYLDGAHTLESIAVCAEWFKNITATSTNKKALMFNITGDRDAARLLKELGVYEFDAVLFVTNIAGKCDNSDNLIFKSTDNLLVKCRQHKDIWSKLQKNEICEVFPTVYQALQFLTNQDKYDLLVTGSILLIGSVLNIINPELNET